MNTQRLVIKLLVLTLVLIIFWSWARIRRIFLEEKQGFVPQKGSVDCALACARMVGDTLGRPLDPGYLRARIPLGRNGTSLLALKLFFEEEGFTAEGCRCDLDDLVHAEGNFIATVHPRHFVVVQAPVPGGFLVKDPALGILKVPMWFMRIWYTGTYLRVELPQHDSLRK